MKGTHDRTPIPEVLSRIVDQYTSEGDSVLMKVTYKSGDAKPDVKVEVATRDPLLRKFDPIHDVGSYLPDTHTWPRVDGEGELIQGDPDAGPGSWVAMLEGAGGVYRNLKSLCVASGRACDLETSRG